MVLPPAWDVTAAYALFAGLVDHLSDGLLCGFEVALGLGDSGLGLFLGPYDLGKAIDEFTVLARARVERRRDFDFEQVARADGTDAGRFSQCLNQLRPMPLREITNDYFREHHTLLFGHRLE